MASGDALDARQQHRITVTDAAGVPRTWVLRRLGLGDHVRIGGRAAALAGGPWDQIGEVYQVLAIMIATIEQATVDGPADWRWGEQPDDTLLGHVWEQYQAWEQSFRGGVARGPGDAGGGTAGESAVVVPPTLSAPAP